MTFAAESRSGSGRGHGIRNAVISAVLVVATSLIGNAVTMPKIPTWYATLAKPWYTPPNWLFGPAWTLLFVLMAIAFWRILQTPPGTPGRTAAIVAYVVQLVINASWSVAFFGMESPLLGFAVIAVFWVAIVFTIVQFARVDRIAAWLLVPYIAWVSFAAMVNWGVWSLN